jgi:DNA-binding beta-propeller fold protein YncE
VNAQGGRVSFDTQGPGTRSGQSVSFARVPTPLTFEAGHRYTFVVYATTSDARLLYVANAAANSITAYTLPAQGNVAPARTISGPRTGLSNPVALAVDADGNIIVANAGGSIEVFSDGANGNVSPATTYALPGSPAAIAVDPFNTDVYVALADSGVGTIAVFSPAGVALRSLLRVPRSLSEYAR